MKKIISLILAVMLVIPTFSMSALAASASSDYSREETLLSNLGITPGGEDLAAYVTRGEFAKYLSKLMNIVYMPDGYKLPYADVSTANFRVHGHPQRSRGDPRAARGGAGESRPAQRSDCHGRRHQGRAPEHQPPERHHRVHRLVLR